MTIEANWFDADARGEMVRVEVGEGENVRGLTFAADAHTAVGAEDTLLTILANAFPGDPAQDACKGAFQALRAEKGW